MPAQSLYKRLYRLYRPHFGIDTQLKRIHLFWMSLLIIGNIGQALLATLITIALDSLMAAFVMEGLTWAIFLPVLGQSIGLFILSAALGWGIYYCFNKLVISLGHSLDTLLRNKWLSDSKAYHGYKFFLSETQKKVLDVSDVIVSLPMECTELAVDLAHDYLSSALLFAVGGVSLALLSVPIVFSIFSTTISIPAVLLIGSMLYGVGADKLQNYFSKKMKPIYKEEIQLNSKLKNEVNYLNHHSENVAFKDGTECERKRFKAAFAVRDQIRWVRVSLESKLAFLNTLHSPLSILVVSILSLPSIIAKKVAGTQILGVMHHFDNIASFLGWRHKHTRDLQSLDIKIKSIEEFLDKCDAWEGALKKHNFERIPSTGEFRVENLSLKTPEGMVIIKNLTLNFELNTITILSGPSGVGKSTLLRAIAGLLPFGEGRLALSQKPEDICILSQQGYIPRDASLLEVILYPHKDNRLKTVEEKDRITQKVVDLLKRFGFKAETIEKLHVPLNWNEILSGGEKQRIAYISAIVRNPKVLLMDEPSSALDESMQKIAENILHSELPNTTMVLIDHHPLEILPAFGKKRHIQKISVNEQREFIPIAIQSPLPQRMASLR